MVAHALESITRQRDRVNCVHIIDIITDIILPSLMGVSYDTEDQVWLFSKTMFSALRAKIIIKLWS